MDTARFDYALPADLIAQFPAPQRTASRLVVVPAGAGDDATDFAHLRFAELGRLLHPGDLLVGNDTRVLPARVRARKPSGGGVEIMLERLAGDGTAVVQLRANKPIRPPQILLVGAYKLLATARRDNFFVLECATGDATMLFHAHGDTPLPPYIARAATAADSARYQTVYSRADGAVAAPTAGLHFDHALLAELAAAGIHWATVTLHIGAGTFSPVRATDAREHRMHREWVRVDARTCDQITQTRRRGGRVVAVGTTVVRALESAAQASRQTGPATEPIDPLAPFCGDTDLFILPGHRFRAVDALITNFHLPRSTLLMMVCAFAGHEKIMRAYRSAVARGMRFYSYGDAMFIERSAASAKQIRAEIERD